MVGDSWHADIEGALGAGIAAVWLNREKSQTPASTRLPGQKWLESRANAGLQPLDPVQIHSLAPLAAALTAISDAYQQQAEGPLHAQLETLAS
jgi:FMN phosphatase YigB (HAD superfamily)